MILTDGILDFETQSVYSVIVQVTDSGGNTYSETLTINVNDLNDAPTAGDDAATVNEGATLNGTSADLLGNDVDADGDALTVSLVSGPTHGGLTLNPDGSFTYTHDGSETTHDSFQYRVTDGSSSSDVATVNISVVTVNDAPIAAGDAYTTVNGAALTDLVGVLANDFDAEGNPITAILFSAPVNGTLVMKGDGSFTYVPDAGFFGTDWFAYQPTDGTSNGTATIVTIDVISAPLPPTPPGSGPGEPPTDEPEPELETEGDEESAEELIQAVTRNPLPTIGKQREINSSNAVDVDEISGQYIRYLADVDQAQAVLQMLIDNTSPNLIQDADELRRLRLLSGLGVGFDANFLWSQMDELAESEGSILDFSFTVGAITSVGTLGYILWSLRGGALIATALTQLPSWRMIDPLPVLESYNLKVEKRENDGVGGFFE